MTDIVVGVDSGGTKTRVIVSTLKGEQLLDVSGPGAVMKPGAAEECADIIASQVVGALSGISQVAEAAEEEKKEESVKLPRPKVIFVGIAGVGREAERVALQIALSEKDIADEVVVDTDASVALADAFGEKAGVILIAGTGSIAFGRSPSGEQVKCGGWGLAIGDEGSGAWIGRRALNCIAAAHDGREPATALTGAILTATELNDPEDLVAWSIEAGRDALAALVPSVVAVAKQDDLRANAIIDIAVEELVLHVKALAKRLFIDERASFQLALAGGLLSKGAFIRKRLERRLKVSVPGAEIRTSEVVGARGAVGLAVGIANPLSAEDKIRAFQDMGAREELEEEGVQEVVTDDTDVVTDDTDVVTDDMDVVVDEVELLTDEIEAQDEEESLRKDHDGISI